MMLRSGFIVLWITALWLMSFNSVASPSVRQISHAVQSDCVYSGHNCLNQVLAQLAQTPAKTFVWYELTLLRLDSMHVLRQELELFNLTTELVKENSAPPAFLARVYIYHAKLLHAHGQPKQGQHYMQLAMELLDQLQQASPQFLTELRLANLLLYLGDYEQGYRIVRRLENQLQRSHDYVLLYDLYNNLGHFAQALNQPNDHIYYRQQALAAVVQSNHPAFLAQAHYNLARSYYMDRQWQNAEPHFVLAHQHYLPLRDTAMVSLSTMYLAACKFNQEKYRQARELFAQVDPQKVPYSSQPEFKRVQKMIQRQSH